MAWLYEKSAAWRKLIHATRASPPLMVAFTATMFLGPYWAGQQLMYRTNPGTAPGVQDNPLEAKLRKNMDVQQQVLARAQKARLQVLLDDVKSGTDGERYTAALNGATLGTHTGGTTVNAAAVGMTQR